MGARQAISKKVTEVYGVNGPHVYKGTDYDGSIQAYGWWYKPFACTPIYLGTSKREAFEILANIQAGKEG